MDPKLYMIVDLEKKGDKNMFITEQVEFINKKVNSSLWSVKFHTSPHFFTYNPHRLLFLYEPHKIDLDDKGLYIDNEHITDVKELLCFSDGRHTYYHLTHNNGYFENFESCMVYISRTRIDTENKSNWEYLKKLADETGLMADDDESILSKQYELVDVNRTNVPLYQYLDSSKKLSSYNKPSQIFYPFGCNASQKSAVEAALSNQVSIIQGPPGTGKTQTILNIIANLLIKGKTVLVVSNNNSAVDNVSEKMAKVGLGFLIAKLGSADNKKAFINGQSEYPDMNDWIIDELRDVKNRSQEALQKLAQGFDAQTSLAQCKAEYDALMCEYKYNDMFLNGASSASWLNNLSADKVLTLIDLYQRMVENNKYPNLFFRIKWALTLNFRLFRFLKNTPSDVLKQLSSAYYKSNKSILESKLSNLESSLSNINIDENTEILTATSLRILKHEIARRRINRERKSFTLNEIKPKTKDFLKEYPVVLSTTYSAKSCISKNMVFDYVIMDEASQVDIKTGALSLSCAMNAVIVGDDKQLPNVVSHDEKLALDAIRSAFNVSDEYDAASHSFLQSCVEIFKSAPVTLLREHYRCHPKIIEFCNRRFYNNELVSMTTDLHEPDVLQVIQTVKGDHARNHINQREIDVIQQEIMPQFNNEESVGIITPYRLQAEEINRVLHQDIASTVHKYQGRECDTIIMSMVDNKPTEFSDDPNLLNVAISRAKKRLCVVTNGNDMDPESNLAQLIAYVRYNNFEVRESHLHSVFDLLYKQYTTERLKYESTHKQVSEHLSENLTYDLLLEAIAELQITNMGVLCHYPLSRLIADSSQLNDDEKNFVDSPFSHVDFLLYNTLTKQPRMVIEVDGWHFHNDNEAQKSRDALKDRILSKFGLKPQRISTTDTVNLDTLKNMLK